MDDRRTAFFILILLDAHIPIFNVLWHTDQNDLDASTTQTLL
jgi:hypothetical protein